MEVAGATSPPVSAFHHLIIATQDPERSADYFHELLQTEPPFTSGSFRTIVLDDEVVVNFADPGFAFPPQHYAFLVDDTLFDEVLSEFERSGTEFWADPQRARPGEHGDVDGVPEGRRMYFLGPDSHYLELLTARYILGA
jgi:catechol 2,3-dioxygenase-like lactoylglutathione lyase family enzyme